MPTADEVSRQHYRQRRQVVEATAAAGVALWREVSPSNLSGSWLDRLARLLTILTGAQLLAARPADGYISSALRREGFEDNPEGEFRPQSLVGVASDGRPLDSLLQAPVVAAKDAIARGRTVPQAMATGQATLDRVLRTQVADAGRVADGVAVATRPTVGYVRALVPPGDCARCVILAGRFYRWSAGFQRHPNCNCVHVPAKGKQAAESEGLVTDPKKAFDGMSESEQDRMFTKAGAQAIRDGADINQVVNARRGMRTAAGRRTTTEGTSRRGLAGQRLPGQQRLMPEQIYREASSREDAIRLLRRFGYII